MTKAWPPRYSNDVPQTAQIQPELRSAGAEEQDLIRKASETLRRTVAVWKYLSILAPVILGAVLYLALHSVWDSPLLNWMIPAIVFIDAAALLWIKRNFQEKLRLLEIDYQMSQVEDHLLTDIRQSSSLRSHRIDRGSLRQASAQFIQSHRAELAASPKGTGVLQLLAGLGPIRLSVLPRSRLVLKIEKADH